MKFPILPALRNALFLGGLLLYAPRLVAQEPVARNPTVHADVPDMAMIRVGDTYYMSSTTMHLSPGVPIMKSRDLVNWQLVSYAYDTLASLPALNLANGQSTYGRGSWASSLRLHQGTYYVSTFAQTTGQTYIFSTKDIEHGPWKRVSFKPSLHDHSLFFDDDARAYMVYGGGQLRLVELAADLSGPKPGTPEQVLIDNASAPAGDFAGLALLQRRYGLVGVRQQGGAKFIVMVSAESEKPVELQRLPLTQNTVYFKAECDFTDRRDVATFFYSLDGNVWLPIGRPLHMAYMLPHFMGYRFGLFNYATRQPGGYADFDYFRITDQLGR